MTDTGNPMAMVAELANHLGVRDICDLPGCWEEEIDASWWIAVNGQRSTIQCSRGPEVMPFTAYVEYNGWPAGIVNGLGEGTFAAGTGANPDAFAAAIRRRCQAVPL